MALALCCLGLAQGLSPASAAEQRGADAGEAAGRAASLLVNMSKAARSLDYEGTLVYLHENRLDALSLVHRVENGRIQERLLSLNGPVQAVARQQDRVMCVLPDGRPISVDSKGQGHLFGTDGIEPALLDNHYQVEILGVARIAGRDTDVVTITPRDGLRYGYRFHIDRETALPLKLDLINAAQDSLEQLMFTSIQVRQSAGPATDPAVQTVRNAPAASGAGNWRFEHPPPGFQLVMHEAMSESNGSTVEHYMFTDRLSAYSVYIEGQSEDGLIGTANIGAVHAAGRKVNGHQITAVGEVPLATVQAAIASAQPILQASK